MAPRRQAKQAAAESVVAAAADGNVTPPKKRKTAAKSAATNFTAEPKQVKGRSRQAKVDKQENEVAREPASPLKKSRGRQKNAAGTTTAAAKNDTKSKPKKRINKEAEDATVENNDAHEEIVEKKARGGKATMKKAEIKVAVMKSKAKVPAARKQNTRTTVENSAENLEKQNVDERPVKRTTRRMKAIEESDVPIQPAAKVSRKRKNIEDTNEAIIEARIIEKEEKEEENKEEKEAKVDGKKLRGKPKKMESDILTSKGRSKKNPARESSPLAKSSPKEAEIKKQNAMIQEDNPKTKNMKNAKKGNVRKAALKGKFDTVAEMINDVPAEEAATPEVDVKENGEAHMAESKQKKRNARRANMAVNGKVEAKGKQKKGQVAAASVNETEKDVATENEITKTNVASEIDGNDTKNVSLNKDDSVLEIKKEEIDDSKPDSMKNDITTDAETSINEVERLGTFLCF